ncbi:MAG: hypothetical protein D4R64_10920 [Porphyromonadaceae bacterium]|nr:MAG: hypothetical protein D4R64_10920 [Porphyromonadaceae bacterium]
MWSLSQLVKSEKGKYPRVGKLLKIRRWKATYDFLAGNLAFRGGTALHKWWLLPQVRYSEDIDLVRITPSPIGDVLWRLVRKFKM